ncbi:MAG TPA: FeoB small GTPase domain-containing protein, partial [Gemmatimonadota bacterium]|nr:FeoB small GTPase domain-containing protein [Gemmatimonadota bacterium]
MRVSSSRPAARLAPRARTGCPAHGTAAGTSRDEPAGSPAWRVVLVGAPNVGKSTLFHRLTGRYATVSNYPRTSVEVTHGHARLAGRRVHVVDTPGMYSLLPTTEEERVGRSLVLEEGSDVLVHVVEARCLRRSLPLTLELMELGKPMVLAINMMDELTSHGIEVWIDRLAARLGIEVVPIVAVRGRGVGELADAVARAAAGGSAPVPREREEEVGRAVSAVAAALAGRYPYGRRAAASLLVLDDEEVWERVRRTEPDGGARAEAAVREALGALPGPGAYLSALERRRAADELLDGVVRARSDAGSRARERLGRWLSRPVPGVPVLLLVLWLGLYEFVGRFGAGTLVDWIEGTVFL